MYKILTREGLIEVSSDHSLIINGKEVKPSSLKIGDKLDLIEYPKHHIKFNLDNELCWLLGFFVAEGSCGSYKAKKGYEYPIQFNNLSMILLKKAKKILNKFGIKCKIYNCLKSSGCNKLCIIELKKSYSEIFRNMCYTKNGMKKIPYQILNSNFENIKYFLEGLYDGDGYYSKQHGFYYTTNSKTLALGVCYFHKILNKKYTLYIRNDKPDIIQINTLKYGINGNTQKPDIIRKIIKYTQNDYIYDIETQNHHFCGGLGNILLHNTETDLGKPFLLGFYMHDGDNGYHVIRSLSDILEILTSKKYQNSVNLFYNLTYDAEGILKFFPQSEIIKIYFKHNIELIKQDDGTFKFIDLSQYEGLKADFENDSNCYRITYIPSKLLRIKHGHMTFNYYDLLQYYSMSLDKAGKKYLKLEKLKMNRETISKERFFRDEKYRNDMIKYVIRDSEMCQKLGDLLFQNIYEVYNSKKFMSSASISEDYITHNVKIFLPKLNREIINAFLSCYHGGRFEILKRGKISNAKEMDISSAYGAEMANMPMLTENFNVVKVFKENFNCLYGTYNIDVNIPNNLYVSPLPYFDKKDNLLKFPTGSFKDYWIDKIELEYLNKMGFKYKVNYGYEIYDDCAEKLLKPIMENAYKKKQYYKNLGDDIKANTYKTITNATYGKFVQTIREKVFEEINDVELINKLDKNEIFFLNDKIYMGVGGDSYRVGSLFAPFYASFITAKIRIKLLNTLKNLNDKSISAMHTDSLITTAVIKTGNEMGDWELKKTGDLELYKCGYYKLGDKTRCRGYSHFNPEKSMQKRRIGLGYAVHNSKIDDLNVIFDKEIAFNLSDNKRQWFKINKDLEDSKPLKI